MVVVVKEGERAMIKVNEYFRGKVKSLGFELDGIQYTTGVMLPGEYSFDTEKEEHITSTSQRLTFACTDKAGHTGLWGVL